MICLFLEDSPSMLLSNIKRTSDGKSKSGFVENGGWNFEIRKGQALAKSGNYIVHRWDAPDYYEMEIPENVKGDYNKIMYWATKEYQRINK